MRYLRVGLLIAFAAAVLVLPNTIRVTAADNDETKDREAIDALMWKYARALDTMNAEAYVSCYTPDGAFGAGANATKGADALRKMITDLNTRRDEQIAKGETPAPMYHMEMNKWVEFIGKDKARHHTYWQTV